MASSEHIALSVHSQVAVSSIVIQQQLVAFAHAVMPADKPTAASSHPAALSVRSSLSAATAHWAQPTAARLGTAERQCSSVWHFTV